MKTLSGFLWGDVLKVTWCWWLVSHWFAQSALRCIGSYHNSLLKWALCKFSFSDPIWICNSERGKRQLRRKQRLPMQSQPKLLQRRKEPSQSRRIWWADECFIWSLRCSLWHINIFPVMKKGSSCKSLCTWLAADLRAWESKQIQSGCTHVWQTLCS